MTTNIKNLNLAHADKFQFVVKDLPHATYFCKGVSLPPISVNDIRVDNSVNYINVAGTKLIFDNLTLTFSVDEDLRNYIEIFNWMSGIGAPETKMQFKKFNEDPRRAIKLDPRQYSIGSDATLFTRTNVSNLNVKINFREIFPINLSGLDFGFDKSGPEQLMATVTFRYLNYTIEISNS